MAKKTIELLKSQKKVIEAITVQMATLCYTQSDLVKRLEDDIGLKIHVSSLSRFLKGSKKGSLSNTEIILLCLYVGIKIKFNLEVMNEDERQKTIQGLKVKVKALNS
jgi:uncharacterized protein YoxC